MSSSSKSREHHWWPVGLQKFWADNHGDVSWISPEGSIQKKRAKNRKIAYKSHGHTMLRGSVWETNFEDDFQEADNAVPRIIKRLESLKPYGRSPTEFFNLIKLLFNRDRSLKDMCHFYNIEEAEHRLLLQLLISLLIRSPSNRFRMESYPKLFGLPTDEGVGKANMHQRFRTAKELCETGLISNQYFVLIHTPLKRFTFGDGNLDWLTAGLVGLRLDGRALVPLTPHLCVYFCTPRVMRSGPNCASFSAAPWMVDWINDITQIYSRDQLFFLGRPPKLSEAFQKHEFLEHKEKTDELIAMLDEIAGNQRSRQGLVFPPFR